ncbi:MAG TPA: HlyD family efflux transporter periplasmic adaptor subunit [Nitriliruptorales bacterium]
MTLLALLATACSSDGEPAVQTAEVVSAEVVQTVAAPARLEPRERRAVTATVPGVVARLLVGDGDEVAAGEPVVRLESGSVDLAIAQAGAAVDAAGALTGVSLTPDLSPLVGSVRAQLEATLEPLIAALSRQAREVGDPVLRERALAGVAQLVNRYQDTRSQLLAAEQQARGATASASAAQRQVAQAQQDQAELALQAARGQQDGLELVAPIGGTVELGRADGGLPDLGGGGAGLDGLLGGGGGSSPGPLAEGALVVPGQVLFTVYDLGGFHARATVDEIDVVLVEAGQRATVLVDAFPDLEVPGVVRRVAIAPDTSTTGGVIYPVEVQLTGVPDGLDLRVGLTASVEIVVATVDSDRVVPSAALRRRDSGEVVLVVRDGTVRVVPVEVQAIGEDTAAVVGDVEAGERVVIAGAERLDDGDPLP